MLVPFVVVKWKVDCNEGNWDFDRGDWDIDSGGDCDSENNVEDNYHKGGNGVGRNFMDSDGEDTSAVNWNVRCNADCDSDWKGVWEVDSQRDSECNWDGECNADCEGNCSDDWEGDWEGSWEGDCNNDGNWDWDSKWNGGWDGDGDSSCSITDCDIDNDADRDGECNGNNDDHSGGDWVGCGLTDSGCKDLYAVVVKDNDGAADIDANNAKNKKKTLLKKCSQKQLFFPYGLFILHFNFNLYS